MTQARDAVGGADVLDELSDALDDVTDHVSETSRRLSDVIDRANNVSASVEEQFSGDWLIDIINAVSLSRTVMRWLKLAPSRAADLSSFLGSVVSKTVLGRSVHNSTVLAITLQ